MESSMAPTTRTPTVIIAAIAVGAVGLIITVAQSDQPAPAPHRVDEMVLLPGGTFAMGYERGYDDEKPVHSVEISEFRIDRTEVTNSEFGRFVAETGHVTRAELDGYCWAYVMGAADFQALAGADWRHPQGPASSIEDRLDHPVVCVSWADATSFAEWAGKRLPTEAEWEYAARAGGVGHYRAIDGRSGAAPSGAAPNASHSHHESAVHARSSTAPSPSSKSHGAEHDSAEHDGIPTVVAANVWQGHWPDVNHLSDGFYYTAPAGLFDPNQWGVHDTLGNVWEWTADWYGDDYYQRSTGRDPQGPGGGSYRVARGGSWFCSPNYCGAYSTHYRGSSPPDHAFNNVGFRCAADADVKQGSSSRASSTARVSRAGLAVEAASLP